MVILGGVRGASTDAGPGRSGVNAALHRPTMGPFDVPPMLRPESLSSLAVCFDSGGTSLICVNFVLLVHDRVNPEALFRLCVQLSQFTVKLDDGFYVDVPRKI